MSDNDDNIVLSWVSEDIGMATFYAFVGIVLLVEALRRKPFAAGKKMHILWFLASSVLSTLVNTTLVSFI